MFITESLLAFIDQIRADTIGTAQSLSKLFFSLTFILSSLPACACMQVHPCEKLNEWIEGKKERTFGLEEGKKDHRDSGGGTASTTERRWELAEEKKAGRQEAVCDNLVEETGLCAQHCLETENIFYREDLDWIIQVKWSDLS